MDVLELNEVLLQIDAVSGKCSPRQYVWSESYGLVLDRDCHVAILWTCEKMHCIIGGDPALKQIMVRTVKFAL